MKKKILFTACSMEIGGIERSLAALLDLFGYDKYEVDLLLFSKKGEFLPIINEKCNVLPEFPQCASLLKPIKQVLLEGHPFMAVSRAISKLAVDKKYKYSEEPADAVVFAYLQAYWDNSVRLMPRLKKEYDVAISFMWPHHFAAKNVTARRKLAWIHTDYTKAALDGKKDEAVWGSFDSIAAVSAECGRAFTKVYPSLSKKVVTAENILSAELVREQAKEFVPPEMQGTGLTKLLTVGRFCYAKAFDVAVDICKILVDSGEKIKWFAVGYGTDENAVRDKVRALGLGDTFIFLGKQINPYPYMNSCDIYVQPSRYEGKAVTVREAQILGKPVVITDFTTAKSQVCDGVDAVIAPMNPQGVADTLKKLIHDKRACEALGKNAHDADYSNIKQLQKIYDLIEGAAR